MTGTVLNMRSATFFGLLLYSGSPSISRTHPSPCAALPTLHHSIPVLGHSPASLRHQRIDFEVIETRLDALTCARPYLLGHMRPGIPHLHAVGDVAVVLFLSGLRG
jgi:hypothetical protein